MSHDTGVSISFVYPIVKTIVTKGYNKDDFFRRANFDESLFYDSENRLSGDEYLQLLELAADITADTSFGLHQGEHLEVADLGVIGYVMSHSKTLGQALTAYQKYNALICSGLNIDWEAKGNEIIIEISYSSPRRSPSRHCIEEMTSSLYHLMIRLSCRAITLKEIQFQHGLVTAIGVYSEVLGITPQFGKTSNLITLSKDILDYPILFADAKLLATFETIAEDAKQRLFQGRIFSDQLYNWIVARMPNYFPSLKDTAKAFKMSVRSLQARLKQEDTTFQHVLNRVRRELAMGYLAKPEYKIGEVAYLLHFSEPSAFQSAFKKWTGVTPRHYRMDLWSEGIRVDHIGVQSSSL